MNEKNYLAPKYSHAEVENGKYDYWLKNGYFNSGDMSKKPYAIVIPPPNVTGILHLGHAWNTTLQDIIIRQKRMDGYDCLWLPGMDHAGIATQAKIDAKLKQQGISRYDLGREKFLEVAWDWKAEYASIIRKQWAALGLSLDYNKERFTLDEGLNDAVNEVFITLYNEGLLYRGERIINWDIQSKTALSNIEVEYKDIEGAFYHIKYPFTDGSGYLEIATTRPETMFGDTALMVHPLDDRYKSAIGKTVIIPLTTREIPVIADEYVDKEFGTGVVKVTPAHDPNDFEVGNRHNLPRIICMNEDGTMNEWAGKYQGLDRFEARKQIILDLEKEGLCPKIEKMIHSVGHSERTGVVVEPRLSKQWFVKMDKLASDVLDMQKSEEKIEFIPERFNNTFKNWLENTQDWCVSRQLWWGHRIPAWYKEDKVIVSKTCPGDGWRQDEDVLDTWFSSALWPFSTLGWPKKTADLERYFPMNCLVTAYDIIFFWVARMAFQSKHFMHERPFEKCFIHGLIRDEQGRKMSKSLGNGIDPFMLIEKYGCDALRYFLTTNSTPGADLRYSEEKIAAAWNYINKIWNIARYIQMNLDNQNYHNETIDYDNLSDIDLWILQRVNSVIKTVNQNFDNFDFGEVARAIYNFTWNDFAAWYIELTKVVFNNGTPKQKINTCAVLKEVLITVLKLLHPFMPFVTEEIYQKFNEGSIMVSAWPKPLTLPKDEETLKKTSEKVDLMIDIITAVRNIRAEKNVSPSKKITLSLLCEDENVKNELLTVQPFLERFTNYNVINYITQNSENLPLDAVNKVLLKVTVVVPLNDLINIEEEISKLQKEEIRLIQEVERSNKMLNNQSFISKAPAEKVNAERAKLSQYEQQLNDVRELLKKIEKIS